jgi:hypothetical protein
MYTWSLNSASWRDKVDTRFSCPELEVNEFRFVTTLHPLLPTRWPAVVGTIPSSCPI